MKTLQWTRQSYEEWLNDFGVPEEDKKSNGGLVPDSARWGSWIRRNDPVAFNVGLQEKQREWSQIVNR